MEHYAPPRPHRDGQAWWSASVVAPPIITSTSPTRCSTRPRKSSPLTTSAPSIPAPVEVPATKRVARWFFGAFRKFATPATTIRHWSADERDAYIDPFEEVPTSCFPTGIFPKLGHSTKAKDRFSRKAATNPATPSRVSEWLVKVKEEAPSTKVAPIVVKLAEDTVEHVDAAASLPSLADCRTPLGGETPPVSIPLDQAVSVDESTSREPEVVCTLPPVPSDILPAAPHSDTESVLEPPRPLLDDSATLSGWSMADLDSLPVTPTLLPADLTDNYVVAEPEDISNLDLSTTLDTADLNTKADSCEIVPRPKSLVQFEDGEGAFRFVQALHKRDSAAAEREYVRYNVRQALHRRSYEKEELLQLAAGFKSEARAMLGINASIKTTQGTTASTPDAEGANGGHLHNMVNAIELMMLGLDPAEAMKKSGLLSLPSSTFLTSTKDGAAAASLRVSDSSPSPYNKDFSSRPTSKFSDTLYIECSSHSLSDNKYVTSPTTDKTGRRASWFTWRLSYDTSVTITPPALDKDIETLPRKALEIINPNRSSAHKTRERANRHKPLSTNGKQAPRTPTKAARKRTPLYEGDDGLRAIVHATDSRHFQTVRPTAGLRIKKRLV